MRHKRQQDAASELAARATETLGSTNLRQAVKLPNGEDRNEWLAVNIVDFFNQLNMLYGTITEYCTQQTCPTMNAGPKFEYYWSDATTKKVVKCSAPKYIDYLMSWVQSQLDDETIFPSKIGVPFPLDFELVARTIMKRLFRIYAHVYLTHFDEIQNLKEDAHMNTSFKHFMLFVNEFELISASELEPLHDLIGTLTNRHVQSNGDAVVGVV